MLLEYKNAVIYGGGGLIGGAVARAFAASDQARTLTATAIEMTCCPEVDYCERRPCPIRGTRQTGEQGSP